ncbi:Transcription factor [Saitoella coloradoensis]
MSSPSSTSSTSLKRPSVTDEAGLTSKRTRRSSGSGDSQEDADDRDRDGMTTKQMPVPKWAKPPGELLTQEEKKANHIASEQKRRQAIRSGFERLAELVPGLSRSQGRSEAVVLKRSVDFLQDLIAEREALLRKCAERGAEVPRDLEGGWGGFGRLSRQKSEE